VGTRRIENFTSASKSHSSRQEEISVTSCLYWKNEVTGGECVGHRKFLTQSVLMVKQLHSPLRVLNFTHNNTLDWSLTHSGHSADTKVASALCPY